MEEGGVGGEKGEVGRGRGNVMEEGGVGGEKER